MEAYRPHHWFPASNSSGRTSPAYVLVVASSLHLGDHFRGLCAANLRLFLHSPSSSSDGYRLGQKNDFSCGKRYLTRSLSFLERISDSLSASCSSCFSVLAGKEFGRGYVEAGRMQMSNSEQKPVDERMLTNVLLAVNVLVYAAQIATQGKLLLWGAKVNSLIRKGQLWRLATSALLHANFRHLMINCYSLNSIGPIVEQLSGSRRFLAIYVSSAIASSFMSYRFSQSPSVGASGAIFGLIGSHAVFVLRHRSLVGGAEEDLLHIAHVIALNMVIGFLSQGIDNWGHLGGLLGGAAASWILGPAWQYAARTADGRAVFVNRAPIHQFINMRRL